MSVETKGSVWAESLAEFRGKVGGTEPVPAGVAISAVSASLALALLAKVLDITGKRKNFVGNRERLDTLIEAARSESNLLTEVAEEDIRVFHQYLDCVRQEDIQGKNTAMRKAIEIPMDGARAAVRGLELCGECVGMAQGLTAADLAIAAALLSASVRAMLVSVDFNVVALKAGGLLTDEWFSDAITTERRELELDGLRRDDAIRSAINALLN